MMRSVTNIVIKLILLVIFTGSDEKGLAQHQEYFPDPDTTIQRRLEEWQDLKFGLLMHWGTYRPELGHGGQEAGSGG
jgi:alpha-L-fucosidase